jgi:hypothetical protein
LFLAGSFILVIRMACDAHPKADSSLINWFGMTKNGVRLYL